MSDLEAALQLARRHVAEGTRIVAEQSARLARMTPDSGEWRSADGLLRTMKSTLAVFVADLERLEAAERRPSQRTQAFVAERYAPAQTHGH